VISSMWWIWDGLETSAQPPRFAGILRGPSVSAREIDGPDLFAGAINVVTGPYELDLPDEEEIDDQQSNGAEELE
jgi:hypothetical protein